MSARPAWTGLLKIALVQIPIKVFLATDPPAPPIALRQLHETCRTPTTVKKGEAVQKAEEVTPVGATPVQHKVWCATCDQEVVPAEIVKGHEFEPGKYVLLLDAELEALAPEATRVVDLVQVVFPEELELRTIDRAYLLLPNGELATAAFRLVAHALVGKVAIGTLPIYGRQYLVAVTPQPDRTLMLYTLHRATALRSYPEVETLNSVVPLFHRGELGMARSLLASLTRPLHLADYPDPYPADVQRLIDAKIAGHEIVTAPAPVPQVIPVLADALRASLETLKPKPLKAMRVPGPHEGATRRRERQRA